MEPTGPIPFRVAAAYATTPRTAAQPAAAPIHQVGAPIQAAVDRFEPTTDQSRIKELVAGRVASGINRGVDFDGDQPVQAPAQAVGKTGENHPAKALQFHAVSAARVEAATGVALGQTLDVQA